MVQGHCGGRRGKARGGGRLAGVALAAMLVVGATPVAAPSGTRYLDVVYEADQLRVTRDVAYGHAVDSSGVGQDLLLDVYEPKQDDAAYRPAVVWVHGGYFKRGSKNADSYQPTIDALARSGYVVLAINYRLRPELPDGLTPELLLGGRIDEYIDAITDATHDALAAVRWARAHADRYRIDPERVAVVGHSAGGLTATATAFNWEDPGSSGNAGYDSRPTVAVAMAGGGLPGYQVHVDPGDAPILFVHGLADQVVPYAAAVPPVCASTVAALNVCEQVLDPDQGHGTFGHQQVREFLHRWLVDRPGLREPARVTVVP